jgi:hypothetical protein
MIPGSLRTRGVIFARLFGPPRFIERTEAYRLHEGACQALSCDDLSFKYESPEATKGTRSRAFAIHFERKEGRGSYNVVLNNPGIEAPIRFLVQYDWPESELHVTQRLDDTDKAVFDNLAGDWQTVLVEVRIRTQCTLANGTALDFFKNQVFKLSPDFYQNMGSPMVFCGAKLIVAASQIQGDEMAGAQRELSLEVLKEDRNCIYLELMSQWPQVAPTAAKGIDLSNLRQFSSAPSGYVQDSYEYLRQQVSALCDRGG